MPDVSMTTSNVSHLLRLEEGQGQLTRASVSETLEKCGARFRGVLGSPLDGLLTPEMAGGGLGLGRYWGVGAAPAPRKTAPQPQPGFAAGSLQVHRSPSPCPLTCWERSPGCQVSMATLKAQVQSHRATLAASQQTGPAQLGTGGALAPAASSTQSWLRLLPPCARQPVCSARQGCLERASCSGHGLPEDAAVATATKPAKPGARQGPSSDPQGWLPPLDSQTSQDKDVRSACSPPVPGTHPTAAEGSRQPRLKPAWDRASRPTLSSAGSSGQRRRHPRLWPFHEAAGTTGFPRQAGVPGVAAGAPGFLLQQCGWAGGPRAHCHSCCTDRRFRASCAWPWASLLPRPLSHVYKVKLAPWRRQPLPRPAPLCAAASLHPSLALQPPRSPLCSRSGPLAGGAGWTSRRGLLMPAGNAASSP